MLAELIYERENSAVTSKRLLRSVAKDASSFVIEAFPEPVDVLRYSALAITAMAPANDVITIRDFSTGLSAWHRIKDAIDDLQRILCDQPRDVDGDMLNADFDIAREFALKCQDALIRAPKMYVTDECEFGFYWDTSLGKATASFVGDQFLAYIPRGGDAVRIAGSLELAIRSDTLLALSGMH